MREAQAGNRYYTGPLSDHFDGKVFFNPGGEEPRGFTDLLRWQFEGGKIAWPKAVAAADFVTTKPEPRVEGSRLVVTMVGHATLLIQTAGLNILTDPVWSERASPVSFAGPKRNNPPGVSFDDAKDRHRHRHPQPLRPSRHRDPEAADRAGQPAPRHAARQ